MIIPKRTPKYRKGFAMFITEMLMPNTPAQAGRGNDVRLQTEAQSRPCLKPDGYAGSLPARSAVNPISVSG
jgi:hypothetical protein